MNKVTKIVLMNKQVNIHRGYNWHTYYNCDMTAASRIRLNDVLIVWSETGKIESRPYVGPGWHTTNLYVVDVSAKNKALARKIIDNVMSVGEKRARNFQYAGFNDVDFVCGAMAAMEAVGVYHLAPGLWIFGPMSGRKIFKSEEES